MGVKVPTLSMQNWLDDVRLKMNKLFEHFMASDFSQSTLTPRRISSLKYCMASPGSVTKIREDISSAVNSLYSSYFDTVNVNVDVKETDTLVTFSVEIDVIENGKTYSIARAIEGEKKLGKITSYHEAQTELHTSY